MKKFTFVLAALAAATFSFAQETTVVKKTVNDLVTELKWGVSSGNTINGCYTNFALDIRFLLPEKQIAEVYGGHRLMIGDCIKIRVVM